MPQIAMSYEQRVQALRLFNYSAREAQFLCLAALHGGYFVRRQYAQFLGRERNGTVAALIERAAANNHVQTAVFERNAHLYHLSARPFYAAIGQPDNRNRRERQPLTIKNKLMGFDFVLAHPDVRFLATEQEKVECFRALGVDVSKLPAKRYSAKSEGVSAVRYFVDKFPIYVEHTAGGQETISFCFIDEGLTTISKFETYLNEYRLLLAALPAFQMIYVAASAAPFRRAGHAFERFLTSLASPQNGVPRDPALSRLLDYFSLRKRFEANDWSGFNRDQLIRLRDGRSELATDQIEDQYRRWIESGDAIFANSNDAQSESAKPSAATFSTYLLEHKYDLFGTLTAF